MKKFVEQYSSFSETTRSMYILVRKLEEKFDTEDYDVPVTKEIKYLAKVFQILYEITSKFNLFNTL